MKQLALDFTHPPLPTLENFITGRNAELIQNIRRIVRSDGRERFIYLWGSAGSGRSHLLKGAVAAAQAAGLMAIYVACAENTVLPEHTGLSCVALDDVERLDPAQQIAAFRLHNLLRERHGALFAAGDAPPVQLRLRSDLVTRFGGGLVYQVHALTDEEKGQALTEYAARRGFRLPPEVCQFVLTRGRRDMPSLIATLDALDRYSLETKRPVTVPMARELLAADGKSGASVEPRDSGEPA
jgi:DnaA-homolog protein